VCKPNPIPQARCRRSVPNTSRNCMSKSFTLLVAIAVALLLHLQANDANSSERPNVVFIMADDLGIGDVKCYGGERCQIETPNFDRLAREGIRFTDAHANASVCVPTRVAIMSGRYPWRFGVTRPSGPWGYLSPRMPESQFTLGTLMKRAGYQTGYVGKWHLGTLMQTTDGKTQGTTNVDYSKPLKIGPKQYGFDYSFILPGSLDMYPYAFVRNNEWTGKVTAQKGWSAFNRVGPAAEDFEDYKVLDTFSREAEEFIQRNVQVTGKRQPFFLYFALTAPHTPTSPSPAFEGKSKLGLYGDFVMETDHCVGRILAALEKQELAENTLVIATSDHGAAPYAGNIRKATPGQLRDLEKLGHFSSGVYRGYKFSAYEGGLRVPFVVRWPSTVKPDSTCNRLVGLQDLMRTLADLCEVETSHDAAPDSISFLPLLKDPDQPSPRNSMILQSTRAFVIRDGDWKLALCPGSGCPGHLGNRPTQAEAWKEAIAKFGRKLKNRDELMQAPFVQLFDLSHDPGETTNLAAKHPERVTEMIKLLEVQIADGRSTPGPRLKNDRDGINYFSGVPKHIWQ
jgi:arylsulfatase A